MFTGLVQAVGRVAEIRKRRGGSVRVRIDPRGWGHTPARGDSISVSGCCLTVANDPAAAQGGKGARGMMEFDAVPETMRRTKLGALEIGSWVNLEHAATPTTLMGGHVVQGHVDGVGEVVRVQKGEDWRVRIRPLEGMAEAAWGDLMPYIVPKGSITVDGVSLTVAGLWDGGERLGRGFEVALIPTTLENTTLRGLRRGEPVNLEVDLIAKTVVHYVRNFVGSSPMNGSGDPAVGRPGKATRRGEGRGRA